MGRHRGKYQPGRVEPYELSRSKVEKFIQCPACFWLDRVKGVHFPSLPGFNLNTNTDKLLKLDFDRYRGNGPHPVMAHNGLTNLRPYAHDDFEKWETSLHFALSPQHFNTVHRETNICFGGGLDDVWQDINNEVLHIVDYKSTAQLGKQPKPLDQTFLDGLWKEPYKRQMEMYQWVMRRKGFNVSDRGYFLYVDGQHLGQVGMIDNDEPERGYMQFKTSIISYDGNDNWVEDALINIRSLLDTKSCPEHSSGCEYGVFLDEVLSG